MTRIVRTPDNGVLVDLTGKRNGRGAYICRQQDCWEKIIENAQLLNRALLTEVSEAELAHIAAHKPDTEGATKNDARFSLL